MNDCFYCRYLVKKGGIFYCPKTDEMLTVLTEYNDLNRALPVKKEPNSVKAQIDYLKQITIHIYPSCVNTLKKIRQWKWKKDDKTNTYLDEPVNFFDDAMAMLRYSIEEERRNKPKLNRNLQGGF